MPRLQLPPFLRFPPPTHQPAHPPTSIPGGGRELLAQQLSQRLAQHFAAPHRLTDRKPGKGEKELGPDVEFVKPDALARLAAQGQIAWSHQDGATNASWAVTVEALHAVMASGERALVFWYTMGGRRTCTGLCHRAVTG